MKTFICPRCKQYLKFNMDSAYIAKHGACYDCIKKEKKEENND
jgi:hypothetical protein